MIEDFLAVLDLSDVMLVASDTGGALVQIPHASSLRSHRPGGSCLV
jgi:hypothetical protein